MSKRQQDSNCWTLVTLQARYICWRNPEPMWFIQVWTNPECIGTLFLSECTYPFIQISVHLSLSWINNACRERIIFFAWQTWFHWVVRDPRCNRWQFSELLVWTHSIDACPTQSVLKIYTLLKDDQNLQDTVTFFCLQINPWAM